MIPMIDSPQVAIALAARWHRARTFVLISMVGMPLLLGLVCLGFALLPHLQAAEVPWWSVIPVLTAAAAGAALVVWLRRDGLADPASWFPATVLMTGTQLVLGVVPGFGIAVRTATGTAVAVKALLALGVLGAGSAWPLALRACRSLLASPVAELGSTPLRLVFQYSSSRIVIGTDRVDWAFREGGGRLDAGVSFRHLHEVTVTSTGRDDRPALVLRTSSGTWTVPVEEAVAIAELLRVRMNRWEQRVEAAVERERARYLEMMQLLGATTATAATDDGSVAVTVDTNGIVTDIELTERIIGKNPQLVSADLLVCLEQARAAVREHVQDLMVERYVNSPTKEELALFAHQVPEQSAA
ncbi:YbaB/EbfC family nucleoid-associated protein [Lentzea xinjiangensis]|nr:YbaB/EbfC family nucleoid-associated protein [Lentzea xinjiangensis]